MNKELIQKRFTKNLKTYNDNAKIQKIMAEKLLSYLDNNYYNNILEIGCGTGLLTSLAVQKLQFKTYIANDIVSECKEYINKIDSKIVFVPEDIEKCIQDSSNTYDLIISNAALQWVENLEGLINKLYTKLNKDGILLFSTFGIQNLKEISLAAGKTLKYYTTEQIADMLSSFSYEIYEDIHTLTFKKPRDVLKHLKYTGVNAIEETAWTKTDVFKFETAYNNICNNVPKLTYNPIYIEIKNRTSG